MKHNETEFPTELLRQYIRIQYQVIHSEKDNLYYIYDTFNHMRLGGRGMIDKKMADEMCDKWNKK